MYVRNQSYKEGTNEIPENYSGIALSKNENRENANNDLQNDEEKSQEAMSFKVSEPKREECKRDNGGILSGIFERFGLRGIESSDITLLALAILLLNGDDDDYIWVLLLLLLIVH